MTIHSADIDRSSPVPVYYQIAMDMKSRIAQREWELDQRLPTEMELAEQYKVSRITLRQAMAGADLSLVGGDVVRLAAFFAAAFAVTCLVAWRKRLVTMSDLHPLVDL